MARDSYWRDRDRRDRVGSAPGTTGDEPLAGDPLPESTGVVVVGAGIAGLLIANELADRGQRVTVIDRQHPAAGTTGSSTAKVTALHGASIHTVRRHHGFDGAHAYVQANTTGVQQLRAVVDRLEADVGWLPSWASTYTTEAERSQDLDREEDAALDAGLPVVRRANPDGPLGALGAIDALVLADQAAVDPVRLAGALVERLRHGGHPVVERCPVLGIETEGTTTVHTVGGRVLADHVVVTTLLPVVDPRALFARVTPTMSYAMAARVTGPAPEGLHLSIDQPSRSVRPVASDPDLMILGGGGHRVGEGGNTLEHRDQLRAWAIEHFPIQHIEAEWSAHDLVSADSVPFIGRAGDDEALLVATGFGKWGFSHSGAASLLIADLLDGTEPPWGWLFDPRRPLTTSLGSLGDTLKGNATVARHFVGDRLPTRSAPSIDDLAPGHGGIVEVAGTKVAAHRSPDGEVTVRSATCPHLGCQVDWNAAATTWDCPCHGSRFDVDGSVLSGPSIAPLSEVDVTADATERS